MPLELPDTCLTQDTLLMRNHVQVGSRFHRRQFNPRGAGVWPWHQGELDMVVHRVLVAVDQELTHKLLYVAENAHDHGEDWKCNDLFWPAVSSC